MPQPPVFRLPKLSIGMARPVKSRAILPALFLSLVAVGTPPTAPVSAQEIADTQRDPVPLEIFQRKEDLLFRVGYRLATANAPFCSASVPTTGLLVHDAYSYGNPAAVRALFGLRGDIGVQSVAPGSPAELAGLRRNQTITAVDDMTIEDGWRKTDPRWERIFSLRDAIDSAVADGPVAINWYNQDGTIGGGQVGSVPACPTRFELIDSKRSAAADGRRVLVGENFPGFAYDEAEFAAAIAHEMAHNILRHPQTFSKTGWKRKLVRLSERDADRLMPWLLQNAGYDPRAAVRFMSTWGPRHGGGLLRKRTHDGWDERVEFIEAEVALLEQVTDPAGRADWKAHFTQVLPPELESRNSR